MITTCRTLLGTVAALILCTACIAAEPIEIPLWKDGAPFGVTKPQDEPALFVYQPLDDIATRTAVIICPGGGYGHLSTEKEGSRVAEWLNSFGVTALVLRYRHAGTGHKHPIPMLDGQRAIRTVRNRAAEWNLDTARIGVMGFSAGGHLASTLGTHFGPSESSTTDPIDGDNSRPDFLILCYPVISLTAEYTHTGSRDNLLGKNGNPEVARALSGELNVTAETPPTFLFHTDGDRYVPPANSIAFYEALFRNKVPAELHIYQNGGHGVGLAADIPGTRDWPDRCQAWMAARELLIRTE